MRKRSLSSGEVEAMGVRSLLEEPEDVKTYDVQQEHGRVDRTHLDGVSVIKETVNNENTYIVYMYVYSYIYMYDYTPVYIYIYICVCVLLSIYRTIKKHS